MFLQQFAAVLHYCQRHHTRARMKRMWFVLKFAMLGKLVADTARYHLASDTAQRRVLADRIARWRNVLAAYR
jgi:hypothetical protein